MRHRVTASCKIIALIAFVNICLVAKCCGQTDDTESPDYSAIFQQFLLQKIRDGEAWSNYDYEAQFPQRARQEDADTEDSTIVNAIINEYDEISSEESDEEEVEEAEEVERILNTAPYQMTSVNGGPSVDIRLQQMSGSDLLTLEASVTSSEEGSLFRDDDDECVPEIYLVSGHTECRNLPEVNTDN